MGDLLQSFDDHQTMTEIVEKCPLCGNRESSLFDRRVFRGEPVTNRLCNTCSLIYQSPRMAAGELDAFYERSYRELYQGSEGPSSKDLEVQRKRAQSLLAFVQNQLNTVTRYLDIGCSAGSLLLDFQEVYHCKPIGVEPGAAYRGYAQKQGLTVYPTLDEMKASEGSLFDLVSMVHVLEHLPDPVTYLTALREEVLEPDGHLLLEVPNLFAHDCFEVAHLVSFSPHTLTKTLNKAGFKIISLRQQGLPRSKIIPLYITAFVKPDSGLNEWQVKPEQNVKLKRDLGILRRRLLTRLLPSQAWIPADRK